MSPQKSIHHKSHHYSVNKAEEAEKRLRLCGGTCYLIRYSDSWNSYVLSVYREHIPDSIIRHFKIGIKDNGKFSIQGTDVYFETIDSLLAFYEKNSIHPSIETIGRSFSEEDYARKLQEQKQNPGERGQDEKYATLERKLKELEKIQQPAAAAAAAAAAAMASPVEDQRYAALEKKIMEFEQKQRLAATGQPAALTPDERYTALERKLMELEQRATKPAETQPAASPRSPEDERFATLERKIAELEQKQQAGPPPPPPQAAPAPPAPAQAAAAPPPAAPPQPQQQTQPNKKCIIL